MLYALTMSCMTTPTPAPLKRSLCSISQLTLNIPAISLIVTLQTNSQLINWWSPPLHTSVFHQKIQKPCWFNTTRDYAGILQGCKEYHCSSHCGPLVGDTVSAVCVGITLTWTKTDSHASRKTCLECYHFHPPTSFKWNHRWNPQSSSKGSYLYSFE